MKENVNKRAVEMLKDLKNVMKESKIKDALDSRDSAKEKLTHYQDKVEVYKSQIEALGKKIDVLKSSIPAMISEDKDVKKITSEIREIEIEIDGFEVLVKEIEKNGVAEALNELDNTEFALFNFLNLATNELAIKHSKRLNQIMQDLIAVDLLAFDNARRSFGHEMKLTKPLKKSIRLKINHFVEGYTAVY